MTNERGIAVTASLCLERLHDEPQTAALLDFLVFLDAEHVPWELIADGITVWGAGVADSAIEPGDYDAVRDLLRPLQEYALIDVDHEEQTCGMHHLVQRALELLMPKAQRSEALSRTVGAVFQSLPVPHPHHWPRFERALPHARKLAISIAGSGLEVREAGLLLDRMADYSLRRGQYAETESFARSAAEFWERTSGAGSQDLAVTFHTLGAVNIAQCRYDEAERAHRRALELRRANAAASALVAKSLRDLAIAYAKQGKDDLAEQTFREALETYLEDGTKSNVRYAEISQSYGVFLRSSGRLQDAERELDHARNVFQRQSDPDERFADCLRDLGSLYHLKGELARAHDCYQRSLKIYEQHLGMDHPRVASCLLDLAGLLRDQQRYDEARESCRKALSIREQRLPRTHPDIERVRAYIQSLPMAGPATA